MDCPPHRDSSLNPTSSYCLIADAGFLFAKVKFLFTSVQTAGDSAESLEDSAISSRILYVVGLNSCISMFESAICILVVEAFATINGKSSSAAA
ncbi:hypothetical protein ACH5RR_018448 [Cinchona calisaya]|uniref:Uncharacterized protein n=1 Tax=Cinchona calisaya TaxID=153742 RepID=A0ABD2ZM08_9GENT